MATQDPIPAGLRIGVVGGGCSGFQYSMAFENQSGMMDKVFPFDDLKVFVDATSLMYLNGCTVDYVETLEAAGFKFDNPQVKSHLRLRLVFQRIKAGILAFRPVDSHKRPVPSRERAFCVADRRLGEGFLQSQTTAWAWWIARRGGGGVASRIVSAECARGAAVRPDPVGY